MTACHVCWACGGRGVIFDRRLRMDRPCYRCGGSGSGLTQ